MSQGELQQIPGLVLQGIDIYKGLLADMERAMALKEYGEKLKYIFQILRDIDQHLDEDQKKLKHDLDVVCKKINKGVTNARLVISLIREQATTLASILEERSCGTKPEKVFTACIVFLEFAKDVDCKLEAVEKAFRKACKLLEDNKCTIEGIVDKLQEVQRNIIETMKAEIAKQRGIAYGVTAALTILGLPFKVLPAVAIFAIAGPIAIAVTEAKTVPELEAKFGSQRDKIRGYIDEFVSSLRFKTDVTDLKSSIETKRTTLQGIYATTTAIYAVDDCDIKRVPHILLPTIQEYANTLVTVSTTSLECHPLQ